MDWSNPVTYIAIMGGLSILVGIGTWIGRMEYFRGSVEDALKGHQDRHRQDFGPFLGFRGGLF